MKKQTLLSFAIIGTILFGISEQVDACDWFCQKKREAEAELKTKLKNAAIEYVNKFGPDCWNDCKDTIPEGITGAKNCVDTKCKKDAQDVAGDDLKDQTGI